MIKAVGAVALTIVLLAGISATADPEACRGAIRTFKSARSSVGDYLRRYASCVSRSDGHDNCSSEFSRLHSAQDDLSRLRRTMTATADNTPRFPTNRVVGMSALGQKQTWLLQHLMSTLTSKADIHGYGSALCHTGPFTRSY